MKRGSYSDACWWIAANDSAGDDDALDPEVVAYYVTSLLVADLFCVEPKRVGHDVVRYRIQIQKEEE